MTEFELEGYTLGQKHRHYNKLVQDTIKINRTISVEDFSFEESDVINLLNIDVASHNKNVEYILKVFTCEDMLYVSRAVKQSDWLINDQSYSHIVNPKYLKTNLFPQMCTKAIIQLVKHIRDILKDEKRSEQFYNCEENPKEAVKWLPCCSLEFILENMANHVQHIKTTLLRRLCEKSKTVLEIYIKNVKGLEKSNALQACMFLLSSNVNWFLDLVEEANEFPKFNKKATSVIMEKSASRVIDKFDKYYNFIHLPTFIKCLKQENIKEFLINRAHDMKINNCYRYFNLNRLLLFIKLMPQDIRFNFVNDVFINKIHESKENCILSEKEIEARSTLCTVASYNSIKNYIWYQFAPFNIAFQKIQELIGSTSSTKIKVSLLEIVLISAQNNLSHECTFLKYLRDNQKNTDNNVKEEILKKLILKHNFIKYDINTWNILNDVFKCIDVYDESKNSEHVIVEAIILYNVLHKEKVSEIVENKFQFNTLLPYHKKLSAEEKEQIFLYLYNLIVAKLTKCKTTDEKEFKERVDTLERTLNLLKDYEKELESHPTIIGTIKDLVKIKNGQSWTVSMEALFNIKKTWRKTLFEESLALCQNDSVLLNALKHDPSLLKRNEIVVKKMLCSDKLPLRQILGKIKVYWTSSLATDVTKTYTENLKCLGHHKSTTSGLSILLPFKQLQELLEKYTPKEAKVDWAKIDEIELSVQQQFAKNMHNSRPQPFPEVILRFAKGDYLQYALPSLHSIFYNLNSLSSQKYIPYMLDAPVSLQKHGIRIAVSKLKYEQLLSDLSHIWKKNKNASIRSVMFKTVYGLLCKEKDSNKIKATWELLAIIIDNITFQEDKAIYKLLFEVEKVPSEVRGLFYMKSYAFMHELIKSGNEYKDYEQQFYTTFTAYSRQLIEQLEPDFVVGIILEFVSEEFTKKETEVWSRGCVISLISSYLLCTAEEHSQLEKYEKVLLPILKQSFSVWRTKDFVRNNLIKLLNIFRSDIKEYVVNMKKVNPHKMFLLIQEELKSALEIQANYVLLTKWKLTVAFVSILDVHNPILGWEEICTKVANEFGNRCIEYLKEDCNQYFPRIYLLFVKALDSMLNDFIPEAAYWSIYRALIHDNTIIQGYLAAIILLSKISVPRHVEEDEKKKNFQELCKIIREHPSTEIKIHYYNQIKEIK